MKKLIVFVVSILVVAGLVIGGVIWYANTPKSLTRIVGFGLDEVVGLEIIASQPTPQQVGDWSFKTTDKTVIASVWQALDREYRQAKELNTGFDRTIGSKSGGDIKLIFKSGKQEAAFEAWHAGAFGTQEDMLVLESAFVYCSTTTPPDLSVIEGLDWATAQAVDF